jgi:hypothetical protein
VGVAWRVGALLLAVYLATYGGGPHAVDEIAELSVAASLVERGALDANELFWTIAAAGNRSDAQVAVGTSGDVWSKKGLAPSLLMAPWQWLARQTPDLDATFAALLTMAPVTAATGALLCRLARTLGLGSGGAAAAGLLYGLATLAWPYSRLGFGEPAIALAVVVAALAARAGTPLGALGAGLCVALGAAAKPSALALALPFGLYVLARAGGREAPVAAPSGTYSGQGAPTRSLLPLGEGQDEGAAPAPHPSGRPHPSPLPEGEETRERLLGSIAAPRRARSRSRAATAAIVVGAAFAAGLAIGLAPLGWYNLARFGSPLATGYALGAGEDFSGSVARGLAGLLLSPYRGVVWFVPLALAALLVAPRAWRRAPAEVGLALGTFALTLLTYAAWWTWWGGYAWGPRFLLPGLPLLALVVPLAWPSLGRGARLAVGGLGALSALAQLPGALVDFNPFERALRERWPAFPAEGPLFEPGTAQIVAHLARLRGEGVAALDLAWIDGGRPDWRLALTLAAALATTGLALALGRRGEARRGWLASALDGLAALALVVAGGALLARGPAAPDGAMADLLRLAEARAAAAMPGDGTIVLASPEVPVLWAHDRWSGPTYGLNRDDLPREADAERLLRLAAARHRRLWLLASHVPAEDPLNGVERFLVRETFPLEASAAGGARLRLFLVPSAGPPAPGPASLARLADGQVELAAARVEADPTRVELVWRATDLDARGVAAFVHLYADGRLAGQADVPLAAALPEGADLARFTGQAVGRYVPRAVQSGAPPGRLTVGVGLYRMADGGRLPATGADGARLADDLVRVGDVPGG